MAPSRIGVKDTGLSRYLLVMSLSNFSISPRSTVMKYLSSFPLCIS